MAFTPYLFISVGATGAFYTLRETYEHKTYVQGSVHSEVRSFHHFNLSQDLDEALEKAEAFADSQGLKLRADREALAGEMRAITRASAEQLEQRRLDAERLQKEREEAERERQERVAQQLEEGVFPSGPHRGIPFRDAPRDYLTWLARTEFEEGSHMAALGAAVRRLASDLLLMQPHPTLTLGEPKKRLVLEVEVVRLTYFDREAYAGWGQLERVYVVTMVDRASGACLVVRSTAFYADPGERLTLKGTVKEHSEYKGQAQTVLQRISVVGEGWE